MPLGEKEIEEIAKKVAEKLNKGLNAEQQKPAPKCGFRWQENALILECESEADRNRAKEILETGDVLIKVTPKDEERGKES
ncbi:MAG: hypothetical protein E3J24_07405 [Dehalococcoidia bacterium]|nr:MAG: hypothetical protein E3J24_07405 [Dehalococcoidia bacterium]